MSSTFSVFMKGDAKSLLSVIEKLLGCSFGPPQRELEGARHAELFEIAVTFEEVHGLVDDMGIPFEEYPVSLEFARSGLQVESELRESLCRVLAVLCGRLIASRGYADTMVVRDVQEQIEHRNRTVRRPPSVSG